MFNFLDLRGHEILSVTPESQNIALNKLASAIYTFVSDHSVNVHFLVYQSINCDISTLRL